jgi:hypothetical protein
MALLPFQRKACCELLLPLKICRLRQDLNSQTLGPVTSMLSTRSPRTTFWDVAPCSIVDIERYSRGAYSSIIRVIIMEVVSASKRRLISSKLLGPASQKTTMFILIAVRIRNLTNSCEFITPKWTDQRRLNAYTWPALSLCRRSCRSNTALSSPR